MALSEVGEQVLDLVIPYIHDRNSVSLVSRKCYTTEGITRKRLTVHTPYCPNPASLSKRFPFIESLTLKGPPSHFFSVIRITPWVKQLSLEFSCLKELRICGLVVHDEDLETLAITHGKNFRSLSIKKCGGFSSDGLMHVSKYCNQLRALSLGSCYSIEEKDDIWLHELALNSAVLERLHYTGIDLSAEVLTLFANNCHNSLISLKVGVCYLSRLGDAFRYVARLEHFGGCICDEESELVNIKLPPNIRSLSLEDLKVTQYSIVHPFLNHHIRKLKVVADSLDHQCQCVLFKWCPNLEVLYTMDVCGDKGLQVIAKYCKKLRKLTHDGVVTDVGLIDLANTCTELECLKVSLGNISNKAIGHLGTRLENLRKFRMKLVGIFVTRDLPLDSGIQDMLIGCSKLERLDITLCQGGLTDVGLKYIGMYGASLRSLSLTRAGNSDEGFVNLSAGCRKLRKLKLQSCPFSKQIVTSCVFNIPSLRYVWFDNIDRDFSVRGKSGDRFVSLALIRPEFQL